MLDHSLHESGDEEDREFSFWCSSSNTTSSEEKEEEGYGALYHSYSSNVSYLSPTSRTEVIAQGRKELMQMIQEMPESSFELSFQDMVDHQKLVQEETSIDNTIRKQNKRKKKKKEISNKENQICRIKESMDSTSETFLLKMFFPITSLAWLKKTKVGNNLSKLYSSTPSFNKESMKQVGKDQNQSIRKFVQAGDSINNISHHHHLHHNKINKSR